MRRSKVEVYLHFVWATMQRENMIPEDKEADIHKVIAREAVKQGAKVLAINGMGNHIHLVVEMSPTISMAKFMQQVKGVSSTAMRETILPPESPFGWQENYAVFSFHKNNQQPVCDYVRNQKEHHAAQTLRTEWEEDDQEKK
jgi:putative transposase